MLKMPKWVWDTLKIVAGFAAASTLGLSKLPDKPLPGYVPPASTVPIPMTPAVMGVAQADWLTASVILGVVAAAIVAIDGVWNLVKAKKVKANEAITSEIRRVILGVLKVLSENTGINIVYLGGSVFMYKKTRRSFKLKSLERFRLDDYPPRSNIKWTGEKGAIGFAAASRKTVHCNWVTLSNALALKNEENNDSLISSLAPADRFGFSDDELRQMASRYYESLATPILSVDGTRLLGILAIDVPNRGDVEINGAVLGDRDVEEKLAVPAAALIALKMDPSYNAN